MPICDRAITRGLTRGALIALWAGILPLDATAQTASPNDRRSSVRSVTSRETCSASKTSSERRSSNCVNREGRRSARRKRRSRLRAAERARQDAVRAATPESQPAQAVAPAQAAAAAPQAAAASEGVKVGMPEGRPTIATADGRASLAIGGALQFDMGGYFQRPNQNTQFPRLNDGVNLRRGRVYLVGKFDDFRVNITPDFGGSPDGAPTLFEANVNYTGIKPVTATVGYFHPYVSLEDATFPGNSLFLERSGQMALHPNVNANGTPGVSRTTVTLEDFPELRIDFNSLVSTGPLFARSGNVYGGALGASWRNFLLQGEYYQISVNQSKLPGVPSPRLGFNGGYVEGGWVMTGEPAPTISRGRPGPGPRSIIRSASRMAALVPGNWRLATAPSVSTATSFLACRKPSPAVSLAASSRSPLLPSAGIRTTGCGSCCSSNTWT